ncbi:MAG: C25 family cysteine peptidase [Armatimonadota bacterium]
MTTHAQHPFWKALVAFIVLLVSAAAFGQVIAPPGAVWKPVSGTQIRSVQVQSVKATTAMSALRLNLSGFYQVPITRDNTAFLRLSIPDGGVTAEVGKPEVPIVRRLVAVPDGATVQLKIKAGQAKVMPNIMVFPAQDPVPEQTRLLEMPFRIDRAFYAQNVNYPAQMAQVSAPMKIRESTVVLVEMAPMQYNPFQRQLTVYPDIDVELTFSKAAARLSTAPRIVGGSQATLKPVTVINADIYRIPVIVNLPWDYLIITPDAYVDNLKPLVDWKTARGLSVHVSKLSETGTTVAQIKNFIKDAYDKHNIRYVLLVGDTNAIPPFMYSGTAASDYHYALVSGDDLFADLALGRFSARNSAEVDNQVKKSVDYEKSPYTVSTAWYKKAVLISDQGYFQDTSNWVASFLTARGYTVTKLYDSLGNATAANVTSALNEGRALVNYRGHGGSTGWSTSGFSNSNVGALANGAKLPVIISPTCLTGNYDYASSDCYSETWVKSYGADTPRGGVSYWGSSRISYGGYNDELCKGAYKALFNDGLVCMGDIVNKAKIYMLTAYGTTDSTARLELYLFNLFGEPELRPWTKAPLKIVKPGIFRPGVLQPK